MTALDIIVLILMGGGGFLGFMRGFVTEALSLGAWALAIACVKMFHGPVTVALADVVGTVSGASALSFALVFGTAMFAGKMIARRVGEGTRNSFVGSFDRVLGLGFGAVKGLLFASVGFLFVTLVYDTIYGHEAERPAWLGEAKTYTLLNASSRALVDFVNERRNGDAPSKRT